MSDEWMKDRGGERDRIMLMTSLSPVFLKKLSHFEGVSMYSLTIQYSLRALGRNPKLGEISLEPLFRRVSQISLSLRRGQRKRDDTLACVS